MKILFFHSSSPPSKVLIRTQKVLRDAGIQVLDNLAFEESPTISPQLDDMDVFIIEAGGEDANLGYILASAVSHEKPLLVLSKKSQSMPIDMKVLLRGKKLDDYSFDYFNEANGLQKVQAYLLSIGVDIKSSIQVEKKFTLRINTVINEYLDWKADTMHTTKAKLLRIVLSNAMEQDSDFQKYLWEKRGFKK